MSAGARPDRTPSAGAASAIAVVAAGGLGVMLASRGTAPAVLWDLQVPLALAVLAALGALTALDPRGATRRALALWLGWLVVAAMTVAISGTGQLDGVGSMALAAMALHPVVPSLRTAGPSAGWLVAAALWLPLVVLVAHLGVARACDRLQASEQEERWARLACSGVLLLAGAVLPPLVAVAAGRLAVDPLPAPIDRRVRTVTDRWWLVGAVGAVLVLVGRGVQVEPIIRLTGDPMHLVGSVLVAVALLWWRRPREDEPDAPDALWGERCRSLVPGAVVGVGAGAAVGASLVASPVPVAGVVAAVVVGVVALALSPVTSQRAVVLRPPLRGAERRWLPVVAAVAALIGVVAIAIGPPARAALAVPTDDFAREGQSSDLGAGPVPWQQEGGRWVVEDGAAVPVESIFGRPLALADVGSADAVVRAEIERVVPGMGVAIRAVDPGNMWVAITDGHDRWQVLVLEQGRESLVAEVVAPTVDGTSVEMRAAGSSLTLLVDGLAVVRVVDGRHRAATRVGLASPSEDFAGVRFASASVGAVPPG